MSERYWDKHYPLFAVLCLSLVMAGVVLWDALEYTRPGSIDQTYETSEYAESAKERMTLECANLTGSEQAICFSEVVDSEREKHSTERDLSAQRYMAFWAFWMVVASFLATGATLYGLILLSRTWKETKRTADIAQDIGRDQSRAYLHIKTVRWFEENDRLFFTFFVENSGQTPCKRFQLTAFVMLAERDAPTDKGQFTASGQGWSALPSKEVFSVPHRPHFVDPEVEICARNVTNQAIVVGGTLRYTTIYNELFETEFSFIGKDYGRRTRNEKSGKKMSRTPLPIKTFERIR